MVELRGTSRGKRGAAAVGAAWGSGPAVGDGGGAWKKRVRGQGGLTNVLRGYGNGPRGLTMRNTWLCDRWRYNEMFGCLGRRPNEQRDGTHWAQYESKTRAAAEANSDQRVMRSVTRTTNNEQRSTSGAWRGAGERLFVATNCGRWLRATHGEITKFTELSAKECGRRTRRFGRTSSAFSRCRHETIRLS